MKKHLKTFEYFTDIDPFQEEDWNEKEINDMDLYLSNEQKPTYSDGRKLQFPWTKKYYVLINKNGKYYILGDYRFTNTDFKMFYTDDDGISNNKLKEYHGGIYRNLTFDEKEHVLDVLRHSIKMTKNLFNDTDTFYDIIDRFVK